MGNVWLDTLELYNVHTMYGSENRTRVESSGPGSIQELSFSRGFISGPHGKIAIELEVPAARLQTFVFAQGTSGGFEAEITGDGRPLWISDGKITPESQPLYIDVDLFGVSRIELRMSGGEADCDCQALWVEAKLLMDQSTAKASGISMLGELQPAVIRPGYDHFYKDRTPSGTEISVGGNIYQKGICLSGDGDLIYTFNQGKYAQFETYIGIDAGSLQGTACFRVYMDNVSVFVSPQLAIGDEAILVSLPLNGACELRLVNECSQTGVSAVWASPLLKDSLSKIDAQIDAQVNAQDARDVQEGQEAQGAQDTQDTQDIQAKVSAEKTFYEVGNADWHIDLTARGEIVGVHCGQGKLAQFFPATGFTALAGCTAEVTAVVGDATGVSFEKKFHDVVTGAVCYAIESFTPDEGAIRWDLRIRGEGKPWSTAIESVLAWPVTEAGSHFWTAWGDVDLRTQGWRNPLESRPFRDLLLYYGSHYFRGDEPRLGYSPFQPDVFAIPIATVIESSQGIGWSAVLSPQDLTLDMSLRTSAGGEMAFSRVNHRITSSQELHFTMHLVMHEPEWRGGASWIAGKYPAYFEPANRAVHELSGCGAYSMHEGELDVEKLKQMGFSVNWKASLDFPYMGMFLPPVAEETPWSRFNEDGAYSYDGNPEKHRGAYEQASIRKLADYSKQMRELGFHVLSYFNVTEFGQKITGPDNVQLDADDPDLWKSANDYLFGRLADGVLYWPQGFPEREGLIETWGWAVAMDPGGQSYQSFLLEQAQRHVDLLPAADGICIDRLDWLRFYNDREDDGVSWHNGRAVRSLVVSWHHLMEKLGPIMHEQGKVIYCNNHVRRIDLLHHIDGIFGEFEYSGVAANLAAYCGFGKPVVGWIFDESNLLPDPDAFLQRFLHLGMHPMVPFPLNNHSINPGVAWADQQFLDYGPLFNAMKGRIWLLTPGAVEVATSSANWNVFTVKESWLIAVTGGALEQEVRIVLHKPESRWKTEVLTISVIYPGDPTWYPLYTGRCTEGLEVRTPLRRKCALVRVSPVRETQS
ncbi:NPCBM/NEW2 domain-containing protein [Paenibacillus eucommiae]|uniref:Glycosyl hydrolase family 98 putative carbohydrate-binding module domain-containing protein n=1 Tax=Paenibacillus eucommiae TaxID=1355755 RepID=A0ABS4J415_9BACL|nr:NPCBM/NEW2 domain-containing protein [Paenibacillus eucommiae]MBP1994545.1 hypothetical protein [Paenibacillus eucommiae]